VSFFQGDLWTLVGIPLLIFTARLCDVTLATLRIIFVVRGRRNIAPFIGFVEILIWLVALSQVMEHLDRPINFVAYAAGFATGTYVGMLLEGKLGIGLLAVRIITGEDAVDLMDALGAERFGVTSFAARGLKGNVRLLLTVVRRRDLPRLMQLVRQSHPQAFVSISDVRSVREGYLDPPSYAAGLGRMFDWRKGK
jgi:uncharacterized protein YebE (UPF0316 family)